MEIEIEIIKDHKAGLKKGQIKSLQESVAVELVNLKLAKFVTEKEETKERQVISKPKKKK